MTKQEILDRFNDIDFVYNDSSKHDTLSRMLDELLKEQDAEISRISNAYLELVGKASKQPKVVRCKDCKYFNDYFAECEKNNHTHGAAWYCADGERKDY